ncbi:hypothetical protein D6201_12790 [Aurantiacibacter aquimixticola]|uniref:Integrase catalytic domain-containing protein n=1 Tax=Aurantiacibacter aquimixticola TaxID=1958945 RepID=A0A419RNH7_9SPHN|nr:hypothetical protein D6201_12790 [Aurantiacibacter aquimixticola]
MGLQLRNETPKRRAKAKLLKAWRRHHNEERPHSTIGNTPR